MTATGGDAVTTTMSDMHDKVHALLTLHKRQIENIERIKRDFEQAADDARDTECQIAAEFHHLMDPTGCASVDMFEDERCRCGHSWRAHRSGICVFAGCPCIEFATHAEGGAKKEGASDA